MKTEDYQERRLEIEGWPINLSSYRIGDIFYCTADNVSPGAAVARTSGRTREEVENAAIERARPRLVATKRHAV